MVLLGPTVLVLQTCTNGHTDRQKARKNIRIAILVFCHTSIHLYMLYIMICNTMHFMSFETLVELHNTKY